MKKRVLVVLIGKDALLRPASKWAKLRLVPPPKAEQPVSTEQEAA